MHIMIRSKKLLAVTAAALALAGCAARPAAPTTIAPLPAHLVGGTTTSAPSTIINPGAIAPGQASVGAG